MFTFQFREIVVLEDPLDPNNLQHQTEIVQNVAYSEDVETGPDCHLSKKQSELCAVPPPNKSPRLNSSGRSLLVHTQATQQPSFSTQTSNLTRTTADQISKALAQWRVENETKASTFPANLSAKNVKVNSGENLTCDTVYLLKGADGIQFTAVWNGQQFKQFPGKSFLRNSAFFSFLISAKPFFTISLSKTNRKTLIFRNFD